MNSSDRKKNADRVFALVFMAYTASYIARKGYSACMSEICAEYELSKSFAGLISTGYLACYGTGQIFSGLLGDRVSARVLIPAGLIGGGLANISMSLCGPKGMLFFWCLNGCFQSLLWASVVKCVAMWIPEERRSFAGTAISVTLPAGTALSYLISSACLSLAGWRLSFVISGACAMAGGALFFIGTGARMSFIDSMTAENEGRRGKSAAGSEAESPASKQAASPVSAPGLLYCLTAFGILMTIPAVFCNGVLKDGITEWIPSYLTECCDTPAARAAFFVTLLPLINVAGSYIARWINDRYTGNEMTTAAILFTVSSAAAAAIALLGRAPSAARAVIFVLLFAVITCSMQGANNMFMTFIPLRFAKVNRTASVTGFLNACGYLAAALSGMISGSVLQSRGWNAMLLCWLGVSAMGIILSFAGAPLWKKGKEKLESFTR